MFLLSTCLYSQYSIKGTIDPDHDYSWILLYKLENGDQTYVDNADVVDGAFEFEISEAEPSGIYRAYYQIENNLYVEFIYNKEEVDFTFNPENPGESIFFKQSEENSIYQNYYRSISHIQKEIDSIQVLYFKSTDQVEDQRIELVYESYVQKLKAEQKRFEDESEGMIASHIIRSSSQYNPEKAIKEPKNYMTEIRAHFFDSVDKKDTVLSHSSFIHDRLRDYVFYLNQAESIETQNLLQQEAIENSVSWVGDELDILKGFEETLIEEYLLDENVPMIYYVIEEHYNKLPVEYQDNQLKNKVTSTLKTAIGVRAPDFSWETDGETKSLYELTGTDYYIVLFFSSGCPHCQMEVPKFHNFISGIENIRVITIGLEDDQNSWEEMTKNYPEFINVLDMDKWSGTNVQSYGVQAIPSYFVLDVEKRILAKPEDFDELKSMFEER